jgi:hypothetical protein
MLLRKHVGGCTVAGHEWAEDGAVVEVPDELGTELLAIAPGDYEHVVEEAPADSGGESGGDQSPGDEAKQPNKAASAEEWSAFALSKGLPENVVANATRKQLVEHFNDGPSLTGE